MGNDADADDADVVRPEFGGERKELRWMPKEWDADDESETPAFLVAFAQFVSRSAQVLL